MNTISYVNEKSLANIFGVFGLFSGLALGVMTALIANMGGALMGISFGKGISIISIILTPIIYGAAGYISGYVFAQIYNKFIVPKIGGIEIELK